MGEGGKVTRQGCHVLLADVLLVREGWVWFAYIVQRRR